MFSSLAAVRLQVVEIVRRRATSSAPTIQGSISPVSRRADRDAAETDARRVDGARCRKGMFFLVLQAKAELTLDSVAFVEPGGRPGHEGLFPIKGARSGALAQKLEVGMSGAFRNPRFRFMSSVRRVIQELPLEPQEDGSGERSIPRRGERRARQFRLAVWGGGRGFPFQRVHAPLFTAEAR